MPHDDLIRQLIRQLAGADPEGLREAAFRLGDERAVEAVPRLAELLTSANLGVQEAADQALRAIGGSSTVRAIVPLLRSEDAQGRNLAMDILRQVGHQDFPTLLALLRDDDADIRIFASDILGSAGSVDAVEPLCTALLDDPEVNVRYQAAVSLGALAEPSAAACLNRALSDEEWVQFAVIEALRKIHDAASVQALVHTLDASSDLVASMIVEALGAMGDESAVPLLLERLGTSPGPLRNKISQAVVHILGQDGLAGLDPAWRERLGQALQEALADEDSEIQDAAIAGLGLIGGDEASGLILDLAGAMDLEHDQDRMERAIDVLATLGFSPALERAVGEQGAWKKAMVAVEAISRMGDKGAGDAAAAAGALMNAFWRQDRDLQREMVKALLAVAGPEAVEFFTDVLARHEDGTILKGAAAFLGERMRHQPAADALLALLEHPYNDVKEAALESCIALGGEQVSGRFAEMLASPDPMQRFMAAYALGRMGDTAFIPSLREALQDEVPDVRKVALEALVELAGDDPSMLPTVLSMLQDPESEVRLTVVDILGECRHAECSPHLLDVLDDEDDWVRIRSIEALGKHRLAEAVPRLAPFLGNENPLVALKALESLGQIGTPPAREAILSQMDNEDPEIAAAAREALAACDHGDAC